MECEVCLCPEEEVIKCLDPRCSALICPGCLETYLNYCYQEKNPPECVDQNCSYWYLSSKVSELKELYQKVVVEYFIHTYGEKATQKIQEGELVSRLRRKRWEALEKNFTPAINLVAKISYQKELDRVKLQKRKKINQKVRRGRKCMSTTCVGVLDSKMRCRLCLTQFCSQCEQILCRNHRCKKEDLANVQAVRKIVKCPSCRTRIYRFEGCDHMTCNVCKTKFNYLTGELSSEGSHNLPISLSRNNSLTLAYRERLTPQIVEEIKPLEDNPPPESNPSSLINAIAKLKRSEGNDSVIQKEILRKSQTEIRRKYRRQLYYQTMSQIEVELLESPINYQQIQEIINKYYRLEKV